MKSCDGRINENRAPYWEALEQELGSDTVTALRELYGLYTSEMVDWFAGLYDVNVGGYYYSESARDTEGFLPDAESTTQALGFWRDSGMSAQGGYAAAVPEWMGRDICAFVDSLQDPDGYFYHPQWGKNISISRRARDFNWCCGMLESFGKSPRFSTILDGEAEGSSKTLIPEHLTTAEAFGEYLLSLNIPERSYHKGSELSSQIPQIKARGLDGQLIEFLNSLQHPDTGIWHGTTDYYGVNGLMKISGIYSSAGKLLPNAEAAANTAIAAITSDEPANSVVCIWNTWIAVNRVCIAILAAGGEEGAVQAARIAERMRAMAPYCIRRTYEKLVPFRKSGSSFSYNTGHSCPTSQGVPAAVKGSAEGDVNATVIASSLMINVIYEVLAVPKEMRVPMFFEEDRKRYVDLLNKKRENAKKDN